VSIEIDDLPVVETAGKRGRRMAAESAVADAYRPDRLARGPALGSAALSLGLRAAGLVQSKTPFSSRALATVLSPSYAVASYTTHWDCAGYPYNGVCDEACFGFAAHMMDPFYCATCAEQASDPVNNPSYNWHYTGMRGTIRYRDVEPDICNGKDAWKWDVGPCNECAQSATFRCHDGYKKFQNQNYWQNTICQGRVSCDGQLSLCP
jgi:hypothetical protein